MDLRSAWVADRRNAVLCRAAPALASASFTGASSSPPASDCAIAGKRPISSQVLSPQRSTTTSLPEISTTTVSGRERKKSRNGTGTMAASCPNHHRKYHWMPFANCEITANTYTFF